MLLLVANDAALSAFAAYLTRARHTVREKTQTTSTTRGRHVARSTAGHGALEYN